MNVGALFSSACSEWETPEDLFRQLDSEFAFEVDVCATESNALCEQFFTASRSCLDHDWGQAVCWMNPVYGEPEHPCAKRDGVYVCTKKRCVERGYHLDVYVPGIIDFMRKAHEESLKGATVVCLVPARTDTEWWTEYAAPHECRFIKGRLRFTLNGQDVGTAPFPSAIVVMRPPAANGPYRWQTVYPALRAA